MFILVHIFEWREIHGEFLIQTGKYKLWEGDQPVGSSVINYI